MVIMYNKMVKYIDISRIKPPIRYSTLQDTTVIIGNTYMQGNLETSNNLTISNGGGILALNDNTIKLRGLSDSSHTIAYSSICNGPSIQGYTGGRLGTTTGNVPNVIYWTTEGAGINGNCDITGNATITGNLTLTKLPTSTATPTTSTQLTTKAYVDSIGGVSLSGINAFTGTNSFNTNLPTSTATPTTSTQLTTKTYVDNQMMGAVFVSASNAFTGTNTFNTNLPTSTATPTTGTQLTTKTYVDSVSGVTLAGTNVFTGTNTFNTNLPTSTATPTTSTQLATKGYIDGITTNQTYASANNTTTFAGNVAVTGNTTISKQLILTNNQTSTNNIQLNQNVIYLGALGDSSHTISYNGTINGPSIQGWNGVYLGSTQSATNNILKVYGGNGASTNMVTVNGGFTVTGASTLTGSLICNQIYETTIATSGTTSPFTCNMANGSTFYIPSDYTFASNFQMIITNVPTDTTKSYTISVIYRQPTTLFYSSTARVSDTASVYLLGTASTYSAPLFNGGLPTLSNTPNLIIQSFSIISIATSSSTYSRYVTTSVNNQY
jgi:hypothetical protein